MGNFKETGTENILSTDLSKSGNESDNAQKIDEVTDKRNENRELAVKAGLVENNEEITDEAIQKGLESWDQYYSYLVRGAVLRCDLGSHARRLNIPLCHGVYINSRPQAHCLDCIVGDENNIPSFGVCSSGEHPEVITGIFKGIASLLAGDEILLESEKVDLVTGKEYENAKDIEDNVKGLPCYPSIVGIWQDTYEKYLIATNESASTSDKSNPMSRNYVNAITTNSFLVCKYGGLIEPFSDGQEAPQNSNAYPETVDDIE